MVRVHDVRPTVQAAAAASVAVRVKGKWAQGIEPRNFAWIIKDQLAVSERPGGYARATTVECGARRRSSGSASRASRG